MIEPRPFGVVYLHWCPVSNKGYVGQTIAGVGKRWADQVKVARWRHNPAYGCPLSNAIRKYGADTFQHQVLATANTKAQLDNLEKVWMILLQTRRVYGYNLASGGEGNPGLVHTAATKAKISRHRVGKALGNKNAAGQIWTDERKRQVSAKLKGKTFSKAHNEKIRIARTGVNRPDVTEWNRNRWANPQEHERMSSLAKTQRARELGEVSNGS